MRQLLDIGQKAQVVIVEEVGELGAAENHRDDVLIRALIIVDGNLRVSHVGLPTEGVLELVFVAHRPGVLLDRRAVVHWIRTRAGSTHVTW